MSQLQPYEMIDRVMTTVEPEFSRIVVSYGWGVIPKAQLLAAKKQVMKSDYAMKLAANNPQSLHDSVTTAAVLGVDLTEGKRQGWLVPRDGGIAFQIGYKGLEAIHQRLGIIDRLVIRSIFANDQFSWSGDDHEKPVHNSTDWFNESARGDVIGAYSITYFPDGTIQVMLASTEEIYRDHRDKSDSWKKVDKRQYSPWFTSPKAMIEKTMAIIASKQWPAATKDGEKASEVLERLHQSETADYSEYKQQQTELLTVNDLHAFMLAGDSLGVYLLQKGKDAEVIMSYYWWPASPKGLKGACRDNAEAMKQQGQTLYECILKAIEDDAEFQLYECIEAATSETRKMLAADIGKERTDKIKEMLARVKE